jgi:hypothetical protein
VPKGLTPWKKGQSGNPQGRSRVYRQFRQLAELARSHTEKAMNLIARVVDDERADLRLRLLAAEMILDRGWGRPPVAVGLHVDAPPAPVRPVEEVPLAQRIGYAQAVIKAYQEAGLAGPEPAPEAAPARAPRFAPGEGAKFVDGLLANPRRGPATPPG